MKTTFMTAFLAVILTCSATFGQTLHPIELPAPQKTGGMPLMEALANRQTDRTFSPRMLEPQVLSNLLWAAFGINRADGRRTAPSAVNWQETDIYVTTAEGVYLYEPENHRLAPVMAGDYRADTGQQDFVDDAPVNLVFVADYARMGTPNEGTEALSHADTGFISQNVYLYCTSAGLHTVVRGLVPREALKKTLKLRDDQHVTYAQTVGYPAE